MNGIFDLGQLLGKDGSRSAFLIPAHLGMTCQFEGKKNVNWTISWAKTSISSHRHFFLFYTCIYYWLQDVALTIDELMSAGNASEKKKDLLIDSVISQSRHVEERELERWAPDGDESDCLELETMYGGRKWSRSV